MSVDKIINSIVLTLDEVAPVTKKLVKSNWKNKPWVTKDIINMINIRDKAFIRAKNSKNINDLINYKLLRNSITSDLRNNKKRYYEENIDRNKTDSEKLWAKLKELIGDKKGKPT